MTFVEQVQLLVSQATRQGVYYSNSIKQLIPPETYIGVMGPGTLVAADGEVLMVSEPAALLQQLYAATEASDRSSLAPTLMRLLNVGNARVIARTLAAAGELDVLSLVERVDPATEELWRGLIHVLRFESSLFSEDELQTIEAALTSVSARVTADIHARIDAAKKEGKPLPSYRVAPITVGSAKSYEVVAPLHAVVDEARAVLSRIRYLRLAKAIREYRNPAIDADRQVLLSRLQAIGFSAELSNASNKIEQLSASATNDTDIKSVLDLLRTFFEEFTEEACHKVEQKVGESVPSGPKLNHFAPYRQYLEHAGFIGLEESELLQKLYNFLSNQGSHKLGAAPEKLRVAHATVIEWCMLIAGRIQAFLA